MWYKVTTQSADDQSASGLKREVFLLKSESYTDCEKTVYEALAELRKDFTVKRIQQLRIQSTMLEELSPNDKFYRVKVRIEQFIEKTQRPKYENANILVSAFDIISAAEKVIAGFSQVDDYDVVEVVLLDVQGAINL